MSLINACKELGDPFGGIDRGIRTMGLLQIATADLTKTKVDPLAATVRKIFANNMIFHGTVSGTSQRCIQQNPFKILLFCPMTKMVIFSVCVPVERTYHNCEERNVIWGTAGFVTSVFSMTCASVVVRELVNR